MRRLILALLLPLAACDSYGIDADADFGDPYRLVLSEGASLSGDRLSARVDYGGGCATHQFGLRSRVSGDAAEVWLVHDANGDSCEALISETIVRTLPAEAAAAGSVALLVPATTASDQPTRIRLR